MDWFRSIISQVYVERDFREVIRTFSELTSPWFGYCLGELILGLRKHEDWLIEFGIGSGKLAGAVLRYLSQRGIQMRYLGLDISRICLRNASKILEKYPAQLVLGDATHLPFKPHSLKAIVFSCELLDVLPVELRDLSGKSISPSEISGKYRMIYTGIEQHLVQLSQMLSSGKLILIDYFGSGDSRLMGSFKGIEVDPLSQLGDLSYFPDRDWILDLLEKLGFKVELCSFPRLNPSSHPILELFKLIKLHLGWIWYQRNPESVLDLSKSYSELISEAMPYQIIVGIK